MRRNQADLGLHSVAMLDRSAARHGTLVVMVQDQITRELACLPRGELAQNIYRSAFRNSRANDLGNNPAHPGAAALETAERAAAIVRRQFPGFVPELDLERLASV
jgi:hypothetical protein